LGINKKKNRPEKPEKGKEPSNIKGVGIYLIPKEFFDYYRRLKEHTYSYEDVLQKICQESDSRVVITNEETTTLKYPWNLFGISRKIMDSHLTQSYISKSAKVAKNVVIEGNVWIGNNTRIFENAVIKGPCYIGNNCVIGNFTLVRKYCNIEDNSIVGSHAELSNTTIQEDTHVHSGLFGDSIIGKNCRIGGGTITANRRIDRREIKSVVKGELINTGLDYFGTVIGDNTRMGIYVGTMPGVMIGSNVIIGPQTQVRKNVESNCVYYSQFKEIKRKRISDD
jgi:bifunctional UDP-N-acetylglucosamine pyrophosphorylase/glucosamine-1-phosphate N-acetyltransferase